MAWTSPRSWVPDEVVTADVMNVHVRDNLKAIGDAWTSYTPTLAGTGWAIGNGTAAGYYVAVGKFIHFEALITFGSTSTFGAGAAATVSLPVTAAARYTSTNRIMLDAVLRDTGTAVYSGRGYFSSTTALEIQALGAAGTYLNTAGTSSTIPHTWASTDQIWVGGTYEAAA